MNPIRKLAIQTYVGMTSPIRWYWGNAMAKANRYPMGVLFYHRVSDVNPNPWTISTACFENQMEWLRNNFEIISLAEIQERMVSGNDKPAVAITFDDGYADNSLTAIPYLINHQIPATYFVSTEYVKSGKPFPHDQQLGVNLAPNGIESLRLMSRAGIEIGAHTRSHRDLGQTKDPETLFDELVVARDELEDLVECSVKYFAFPYGQFENLNDEVFRLAKMYGFQGVCSAYGGLNSPGADPFHLQRIHGDPEMIRIRNSLTLDPRAVLKTAYPLPEMDFEKMPERIEESEKQELAGNVVGN